MGSRLRGWVDFRVYSYLRFKLFAGFPVLGSGMRDRSLNLGSGTSETKGC